MIPQNVQQYLSQLFAAVGFSKQESKKKMAALNQALTINLLERLVGSISQKKQEALAARFKPAKTLEEIIEILADSFASDIGEEKLKKIYFEELDKILEKILKPFFNQSTPKQLAKLKKLTSRYH